MEEILFYLIKSAAVASIFILVYLLLLKNDTSFDHNRRFLIGGIMASFVLPVITFTRIQFVNVTPITLEAGSANDISQTLIPQAQQLTPWEVLGIISIVVSGALLIKFLFHFISLLHLVKKMPKTKKNHLIYCTTEKEIKPFSFFRYVVYNPALHTSKELEMILTHEETHARQWHSLDVIMVHIFSILLWFNPLTWIYRRSLIRNLEYLADREVATRVSSKTEYQKTLLKITTGRLHPALTNQFYQSFLKKRIMMLNRNSSGKNPVLKAGLVIPFILIFMFHFNVKVEAQVQNPKIVSVEYRFDPSGYFGIITKESTDEDLDELKKGFAQNGVVLKFEEVKRSSKGEITDLVFTYANDKEGYNARVNKNQPEGITAFGLTLKDGQVSFKNADTKTDGFYNKNSSDFHNKIAQNPLVVISGKEYRKEDLNGKTIWIKGDMKTLNPSDATQTYGKKAKDGAIIISTGEVLDDYNAHLKTIDSENKDVYRKYIWIQEGNKPMYSTLVNRSQEKSANAIQINAVQMDIEDTNIYQEVKPLLIVDGEEKTYDIKSLKPEDIESINVLKGKSATEKYGEKGKNGVIEVFLKSGKNKNPGINNKNSDQNSDKKETSRTIKVVGKKDSGEEKSSALTITGEGDTTFVDMDVLFILNGKEMNKDFDLNTIPSDNIESITVLKGKNATDKYGEKGESGVVVITTKDKK